jgi:N-dimethylarginine dimethylaminohydrolase
MRGAGGGRRTGRREIWGVGEAVAGAMGGRMASGYGSQSMVAPLRRVIVKRPAQAFGSAAAIDAQWRDLGYTAPPELEKAAAEHRRFVEAIEAAGAEVLYLPADPRTGLDSIYPHDPGIVTDRGAILFRTGKPQRQGEGPAMADALREWGVPIPGFVGEERPDATAEGGDTLWLDQRTLAVGRSFRTNAAGIAALRALLEPIGVEVIEVHLIHGNGPGEVLHLQSFISLLDDDLAVVHRPLIPVPLFEILQARGVRLVDIPEQELPTQACNVLTLAPRRALILRGNPITRRRLQEAGCDVQEVDGAEISFKGMGGPTCLTRPLLRDVRAR